MGVNEKTHNNIKDFGQALKKGVKARKWRQEKWLMGLSSLSTLCCFAKLLEGKTLLKLKIGKSTNSDLFFFFNQKLY